MTSSVCGNCGKVMVKPGPGRPKKLCPECRTERYGREHKARREFELKNYIGKPCSRCGQPMLEGDEVHLDHVDGGKPNEYRGLSHKICNLRAASAVRDRRAAARVAAASTQLSASVPPKRSRDPGPPREGLVHEPPGRCHCEERAYQLGCWPSQCW